MSFKQLIFAMLTLIVVASAYAWPSVAQVGNCALELVLALVMNLSATL